MNKLVALVSAMLLAAGLGGCSNETAKPRTDLPPVTTTLEAPGAPAVPPCHGRPLGVSCPR